MRGRIGLRIIRATVFKAASGERWRDAQCLYATGRYQGAIYLCGYAIECRLKASVCALRGVESLEEREAKRLGHELVHILDAARLSRRLKENEDLHTAFHKIATRWSTAIRYTGGGSNERECEHFLRDSEALLLWLKT
jgi:HEPN domain